MAKITNQSSLTSKYTLPDGGEEVNNIQSNISQTENMTLSFTKERKSAKDYGFAKDSILQTLTLTNSSDYEITDVRIKDNISAGGTFKTGSLKIDETPYPDYDPVTGFTLPSSIGVSQSSVITYELEIAEEPQSDIINVQSTITYSVNEVDDLVENSNIVEISIKTESITIEKTSTKSVVIKGQTLTFQNVVKNNGNLTNTEVVFKDDIPEGATFVENSVYIDNENKVGYDPAVGFTLEDLTPGAVVTILFDVTIN